jgi:hypothetical protein
MSNKNESAFPTTKESLNYRDGMSGLTKREYFAAQALQGLLAGDVISSFKSGQMTAREAAEEAVSYADAVLARLEELK